MPVPKLKTIELKAKAVINRIECAAEDVVQVVDHWADWLIEGDVAKASNKKPTKPSPTPVGPAQDSTHEPKADTAAVSQPGGAESGAPGAAGDGESTTGK